MNEVLLFDILSLFISLFVNYPTAVWIRNLEWMGGDCKFDNGLFSHHHFLGVDEMQQKMMLISQTMNKLKTS